VRRIEAHKQSITRFDHRPTNYIELNTLWKSPFSQLHGLKILSDIWEHAHLALGDICISRYVTTSKVTELLMRKYCFHWQVSERPYRLAIPQSVWGKWQTTSFVNLESRRKIESWFVRERYLFVAESAASADNGHRGRYSLQAITQGHGIHF